MSRFRARAPKNNRIQFEGKTYRIVTSNGRCLMIGRKCSAGGEVLLEIDKRQWRKVLAEAKRQSEGQEHG